MDPLFAQWVEYSHHFGDDPFDNKMRVWLRRNPPARAWTSEFVSGGTGWSHDVIDERGHLHTASTWDTCSRWPSPRPLDAEALFREALAPAILPGGETAANEDPRLGWVVADENLDGSPVQQWYREVIHSSFLVKHTLWADPATRRLRRRERRESDLSSGQDTVLTVYDQYVYDVEPPPGTFDMPAGKPIVEQEDGTVMPEVWDTMFESHRRQIRDLIAALDVSWKSGDFREFSALWKFGRVERTPSAEEWRTLVQAQGGVWAEWKQEIESVRSQDFVPVRIGSSTFTWGRKKQKSQGVKVRLKAVHRYSSRSWEGNAEVFLWIGRRDRAGNRDLRVVHWDLPLPEIQAAVEPGG